MPLAGTWQRRDGSPSRSRRALAYSSNRKAARLLRCWSRPCIRSPACSQDCASKSGRWPLSNRPGLRRDRGTARRPRLGKRVGPERLRAGADDRRRRPSPDRGGALSTSRRGRRRSGRASGGRTDRDRRRRVPRRWADRRTQRSGGSRVLGARCTGRAQRDGRGHRGRDRSVATCRHPRRRGDGACGSIAGLSRRAVRKRSRTCRGRRPSARPARSGRAACRPAIPRCRSGSSLRGPT